jgi:hypothetical protein
MKAEYLARTAVREKVPLDGISGDDVYAACSLMLMAVAGRLGA